MVEVLETTPPMGAENKTFSNHVLHMGENGGVSAETLYMGGCRVSVPGSWHCKGREIHQTSAKYTDKKKEKK